MATLTIKDKTYAIDKLPDDAKTQLINLQFVDAELARLSAQPYFKPQEPATAAPSNPIWRRWTQAAPSLRITVGLLRRGR